MKQNHPCIVLVDDDQCLTSILELVMAKEGYDLVVVHDGINGLKKIQESHPDLAILDAMLPGLDGRDLCRMLKGDPKTANIPLIMFSCLMDLDTVENDLPADAFITKPAPVTHLLETIRDSLARV